MQGRLARISFEVDVYRVYVSISQLYQYDENPPDSL